jgi:Tfp pilus assembly protein PilF
MEANSQYPNIWHSFGEYYEKTGDNEKALEHYQKAVDLDPKNKEHQEALKRIKKKK